MCLAKAEARTARELLKALGLEFGQLSGSGKRHAAVKVGLCEGPVVGGSPGPASGC